MKGWICFRPGYDTRSIRILCLVDFGRSAECLGGQCGEIVSFEIKSHLRPSDPLHDRECRGSKQWLRNRLSETLDSHPPARSLSSSAHELLPSPPRFPRLRSRVDRWGRPSGPAVVELCRRRPAQLVSVEPIVPSDRARGTAQLPSRRWEPRVGQARGRLGEVQHALTRSRCCG